MLLAQLACFGVYLRISKTKYLILYALQEKQRVALERRVLPSLDLASCL